MTPDEKIKARKTIERIREIRATRKRIHSEILRAGLHLSPPLMARICVRVLGDNRDLVRDTSTAIAHAAVVELTGTASRRIRAHGARLSRLIEALQSQGNGQA